MTNAVNEEQEQESGSDYIKEVFNAIGIESVCWVDDKFRVDATLSHQENDCINLLIGRNQNGQFEELQLFISTILLDNDFVVDESTPEGELRAYLVSKITDQNIVAVLQHLGIKSDLLDGEFSQLTELITETGVNLTKLGWKGWSDEKSQLESQRNTLFIIDHDFSDEAEPAVGDGSDIIAPLIKNMDDSSYCFLFTYHRDPGDSEDVFRRKVISEKRITEEEQPKFSVVSKKILNFEDKPTLSCNFGELTKSISLRRLNVGLYDNLRDEIKKQLDELRDDLCQSSSFEIERVVFNRTRIEGASEISLLKRFVGIKSDTALAEVIKAGAYADALKKIRTIQAIKPRNNVVEFNTFYKKFSEYRKVELFDGYINAINSPLSGGDMFEINIGGKTKQFILIGQDCELAVRDGGSRNCAEVTLVPVEECKKPLTANSDKLDAFRTQSIVSQYQRLLPNTETHAHKLVFKLNKAITVNVNVLELCVFNKNGDLKLNKEIDSDFFHYLPGWNLKYKSAVECIFAVADFIAAQEGGVAAAEKAAKEKLEENSYLYFSLSLPQPGWIDTDFFGVLGKRTQRLKSPYRIELLNQFYSYKSRYAEEHDFTEIKSE